MTSEEIKLALENPPEGKYLNLESVLCEIAYQLAVHNEREVEAMPSQVVQRIREFEGRIAVLEAMLGRNLSTVEFRQCQIQKEPLLDFTVVDDHPEPKP